MILVSALAEGGDQLVAEIALEMKWRLLVPLPMEAQRYAETFEDKSAAARMLAILSSGADVVLLGKPEDSEVLCYQKVETFLAQHAHILIALWDGKRTKKAAGTADVVATARCSEVVVRDVRDDLPRQAGIQSTPSIPVYWFPTKRLGQAEPLPSTEEPCFLPPCSTTEIETPPQEFQSRKATLKQYQAAWKEIDSLNREILRQAAKPQPACPWRARFHAADALAIKLQERTRQLFYWRLLSVLVGFLSLELAAGVLQGLIWVSAISVLLLSVGTFGLMHLNHRLDREHLRMRTLAEHLRVRMFLPLSEAQGQGNRDLPPHLCLKGGEDWLCHVLDAWILLDRHGCTSRPIPSVKETLADWVGAQVTYFEGALARERRLDRRCSNVSTALLCIALLTLCLITASFQSGVSEQTAGLRVPLAILATTALLLSAAGRAISAYRAFGPVANRYALALLNFERASRAIERSLQDGDEDGARNALNDLAKLALRENSEWFALHLERPPDPEI